MTRPERIVAAWKDGVGMDLIAERFGISETTVLRALDKAGVERARGENHWVSIRPKKARRA